MKPTESIDSEQTHWHHLDHGDVARLLGTDPDSGLSEAEVAKRLDHYGPNIVSARHGQPAWVRFLLQFNQPLVYILLAACVVTAFLHEWVDSGVILGVVLVNAVIGFLQESKAEKAIEALSRMVVTETTVRRGGRKRRVPASELVPGDVVLLQSGDRVPADLRLVSVRSLHCDESALTGESLPVGKQAESLERDVVLADRTNQAFAGTLVSSGQGEGIVWATGDRTETGRIAWLIADAIEISTPLTKKIAEFSRLLLWIILGLAGMAFGIGVWRGTPIVETFMAAVALAVGAIPEGLPAAVTIVLAIGVSRMARQRAIIRKLPAVETLGSTTVICSDKTGTLTQNQMTVQRVYAGGEWFDVTGGGYDPEGQIHREDSPARPGAHPALEECLRAGVLCNDSELVLDEDGRPGIQGDPTEAALLVSGAKAGLGHEKTRRDLPRVDMIPFESEHMFRATMHESGDGPVIYKVGAVERLLERCADELGPDGRQRPLDAEAVRAAVEAMAAGGLRVLALARRGGGHVGGSLEHDHVQDGLTFLGLQGMIDPPRPEAIRAVARCRQAGISVKMITGDHAVTAKVIAARIGLGDTDEVRAVTGQELAEVPDGDLPRLAEATEVFARVAPEQKLRLVEALQSRGHVVAMTGDGVNDAPALKQADIGVAMGISGTDVAKGAADMILTDDNFASIEAAVEEGRGVFENLRKFIIWTLPTNVGEGGIILVAMLLGMILPVLPVQLLWVNMTTAIFLGLMLVFEPKSGELMHRPPRPPQRPLMTYPLFMRTGLVSLIMIGGGIWLFHDEMRVRGETIDEARTAVVNVLIMAKATYLFNCRCLSRPIWKMGFFTNWWVIGGVVFSILVQLAFTYSPLMNHLFHTAPISLASWGKIAAVAMFAFVAVEFEKWVRFGGRRGEGKLPD
jgi:cation-transporting ATPase F